MEDEEVGVKEEVQEAPLEQEEALENEGSEGAPESEEEGTEIDYKAELEKVEAEKENYKKGMLIAKDKLKKKSSIDPEEIAKLVGDVVDKKLSSIQGALTKNSFETALAELTNNADKQKLIRFHYENSIVKTGDDPQSIKNDLENALLIADKKVLFKEKKELAIAAKNREQIGNSSNGGSNNKSDVEKKFFTDEQLKDLKKRGFTDKMIEELKRNMLAKKN